MHQSVASYYFTLWTRTAALIVLVAAILALFVLSGSVLDSLGYSYDVEGGSFIDKVHPSTFLLILCLGLRIVSEADIVAALRRVFLESAPLLVALAAFIILEIYCVTALRVPVTPPIDTYLLPVLFCFALRGLNARCLRVIAVIILVMFAANAIVGIYERFAGTRLFFVIPDDITGHPEDPTTKFDWKGHLLWDWRSSAMLGHPLENAMLTGCFILILLTRACRWIPDWIRYAMITLQLAAMLTFGGRVALVLLPLVGAAWWAWRAALAVGQGHRLSLRQIAMACLAVPVTTAVGFALYRSGTLDKLIERFTDDEGSAQTRLTMWRLFNPLSVHDVLTGPNPDVVATHVRLEGLELGIESFWAGLPLTYGIVMTLVLLVSWAALSIYLVRSTSREAWFPIVFYFAVGSTSAGLASKTISLGFFVMLVLILMRASPEKVRTSTDARSKASPRHIADPALKIA